VGVDSVWKQENSKPESAQNAAETPVSSARFVSHVHRQV